MTTRSTKVVVEVLGRPQDPPITPQSLPAVLSRLLIANRMEPIHVDSEYITDVVQTVSTAEERLQLTDRPLRTQRVLLTGMDQEQSTELLFLVMRLGKERQILPLFSDHSKITATSSSGTNALFCDTRFRRFHVGARVLVHDWSKNARINTVELATIEDILSDRLILTANLTNTFTVRDRAYPLLDTELQLSNMHELFVPEGASGVIQATEIAGHTALPATALRDDDGFSPEHNGVAIFSPRADWTTTTSVRVIRPGSATPVGRSRVIEEDGERPRLEFTQRFTFLSRADWWDLHRFLDARRGRSYPFFYVAPHTLFTATALTSTDITVQALKNTQDFEAFIQFLGIREKDGTLHIRGYTTPITDNFDGTWTITFDTVLLGVSLADVQTVTSAHLVRNKSDVMSERWTTDETTEQEVTFQELPRDEVATIVSFTPALPVARSTKIVVEVLAES